MIGKSISLDKKRGMVGYLFILPWIVGFLLLLAYPFLQSIRLSFSRVEVTPGGYDLLGVGSTNYSEMLFVHANYVRIVTESLLDTIANVPLILIFSLFAASLVQHEFRGRTLTRAIFFLPVILGSGVVLRLQEADWMNQIMQAAIRESDLDGLGLQSVNLRTLLLQSGLNQTFVTYITDAVDRIFEIISASGVQILVFLAGLQSISPSLYEAAKMEGATGWEMFWKVTFPVLSPLILANSVYTIIDSFTRHDNETMELVRDVAFARSNYGLSAAMAWGYFILIAIVLAVIFFIGSRSVFYQER